MRIYVWYITVCMCTVGLSILSNLRCETYESTTQDRFDNQVLRNHVHKWRLLACKTCRSGDGRMDRQQYFCGRCNEDKDRTHFSRGAIDNWNRRGRKEGALKCKEDTKAIESGAWIWINRQYEHTLYLCINVCLCGCMRTAVNMCTTCIISRWPRLLPRKILTRQCWTTTKSTKNAPCDARSVRPMVYAKIRFRSIASIVRETVSRPTFPTQCWRIGSSAIGKREFWHVSQEYKEDHLKIKYPHDDSSANDQCRVHS